jgi:hypothetical protein
MSAFMPMFIGEAMKKYSDRNIGVIVGAFIQAVISLSLIKLGFSNSVQTALNGTVALLFLVYVANQYKFGLHKMYREKKQAAMSQRSDVI